MTQTVIFRIKLGTVFQQNGDFRHCCFALVCRNCEDVPNFNLAQKYFPIQNKFKTLKYRNAVQLILKTTSQLHTLLSPDMISKRLGIIFMS